VGHLQKSVTSTAGDTLSTVHLGVALKGILNVYEEPQPLARPRWTTT
jgi:hypothetical protein